MFNSKETFKKGAYVNIGFSFHILKIKGGYNKMPLDLPQVGKSAATVKDYRSVCRWHEVGCGCGVWLFLRSVESTELTIELGI